MASSPPFSLIHFDSFRINRIEAAIKKLDIDCAESITIYDSSRPDPARIIKTFCDTFSRPMEKIDFVSTGRSLYVKFESKTGSYSGSSLYYWAHYDFFNNTKFGELIPNTICDEIFYAWKHPRGVIRSPLNTLIYKRTGGSDLRCQYKFVTDKRLYARVVIEVTSVTFKELPYNVNACTRCQEERVDKLIIWEDRNKQQQHLACFCDNIPRPMRIVSSGEQMNLEMIVQGQHATSSYFKNSNALFQANYEFAHGPLCGPITMGPSPDGELVFPHRNAIGYVHPQRPGDTIPGRPHREKCIWELKVAAQRDLWMHLDKARFHDKSCDMGRIEVFLAGRTEPRFIICPENVSLARDLPILSAAELGALDNENEPLPVLIQYIGDIAPGRNAFRLVWTELFHLPRNQDGAVAQSLVQEPECDFKCPGETAACIPRHMVCNGIVNCPNATAVSTLEMLQQTLRDNLQMLGIYDDDLYQRTQHLNDEAPEICQRTTIEDVPFVRVLLLAAGFSIVLAVLLAILCRMCRSRRKG